MQYITNANSLSCSLLSRIYYCGGNKKRPQNNQHFILRYYRDISDADMESCLDSYGEGGKRELKTFSCHHGQGNQYFRYDLKTKQIIHGPKRNNHCVEVNIETQSVYVASCVKSKLEQQWQWGFVNETNVNNWLSYGSPIGDAQEIKDLADAL
jgi:polypeptide N-acetylgalactosaminyltransferase